jgi:long-subunit acyl-CoA synthetase (AMP-forming)
MAFVAALARAQQLQAGSTAALSVSEDGCAVVRQVSWRQLQADARQLGQLLTRRGEPLCAGDRLAIIGNNSERYLRVSHISGTNALTAARVLIPAPCLLADCATGPCCLQLC